MTRRDAGSGASLLLGVIGQRRAGLRSAPEWHIILLAHRREDEAVGELEFAEWVGGEELSHDSLLKIFSLVI